MGQIGIGPNRTASTTPVREVRPLMGAMTCHGQIIKIYVFRDACAGQAWAARLKPRSTYVGVGGGCSMVSPLCTPQRAHISPPGQLPAQGHERVRVAFVGDGPLLPACAEHALGLGLDVVLVATEDTEVAGWARSAAVQVIAPDGGLAEALVTAGASVLLSVANLRLLPASVLEAVSTAVNFHDGPLPGYAGRNVTSWALLADEPTHAVTWHLMQARADTGAVVATAAWPVSPDATAETLNKRCFAEGLATFAEVASGLASATLPATPQPPGTRRLCRSTDRLGARSLLDPARPAAELARTVRALDFGARVPNPIGVLRAVSGGRGWLVTEASADGTGAGVAVATADGELRVTRITRLDGAPTEPSQVELGSGVPPRLAAALDELDNELARQEPGWISRLSGVNPIELPVRPGQGRGWREIAVRGPSARRLDPPTAVAVGAAWLARLTGADEVTIGVVPDRATADRLDGLAPLAAPPVLTIRPDAPALPAAELADCAARGPWLVDLIARTPALAGRAAPAVVVDLVGVAESLPGEVLRLSCRADGSVVLGHDRAAIHEADAARFARQLAGFVTSAGGPERLAELSLVELDGADASWAVGGRSGHDRGRSAWDEVRAGLERRAEQPVLSDASGRAVRGGELVGLAQGLATTLAERGVGRGDRVGLAVERGVDLVVAALGILASGAAYVPLDPTYPDERLAMMAADAGLAAVLATSAAVGTRVAPGVALVDPRTPACDRRSAPAGPTPHDTAYVIYTSGSTGRPKGVVVEHRQLVHFFATMDEVVDQDPPGTWLAVTSPSFDISVLELLWTLARGFDVVVAPDRVGSASAPLPVPKLSLFFFAASSADGYGLLLDGARAADRLGLHAVWTPERHFHDFGGPYPNPAVTGAALAAVTERVHVRAGSTVLPLHSPIRVAEEWAVVDQLSGGRVGVSFATGWQPDDFVLNPSARPGDKQRLITDIELVRRLWRGETVKLPGIGDQPVAVRTLPRPVQAELPIWLTSAGSASTFELAGQLGAGVLTHLLGQRPDALAQNVAAYRAAWRSAGHPGTGHVTLMLHTFLGHDAERVAALVREPMKTYLGTSVSLLRDVASTFPTFQSGGKVDDAAIAALAPDELDALLGVAADRYCAEAGLIGTPAEVAERAVALVGLDIDEFACLVDFGVDDAEVLAAIELLPTFEEALRTRLAAHAADIAAPVALAGIAERHGVTHLQCTPSQAAMLVGDPTERVLLGGLRHLLVGGEALPPDLADQLRQAVPGRLTNVYGPTETTVWSLSHELSAGRTGPVPIGRPLANTTIGVLDGRGRLMPVGCVGELAIGGEGVTAGYHDRPELTADRFRSVEGLGRAYLTGDVVRVDPDTGECAFLGRRDNQIKLRGHRIELGEIEAVLADAPGVGRAAVTAIGTGAGANLVGYLVPEPGAATVDEFAVRTHAEARLAPIMMPSQLVTLPAFPLTPNGKLDRAALPAPGAAEPVGPPVGDKELCTATAWAEVLGRQIGRDENFFDAGGNSLAAVQVFRALAGTAPRLKLTDVFRYPTVRLLAAHLDRQSNSAVAAAGSERPASRGDRRRALLAQRERT